MADRTLKLPGTVAANGVHPKWSPRRISRALAHPCLTQSRPLPSLVQMAEKEPSTQVHLLPSASGSSTWLIG